MNIVLVIFCSLLLSFGAAVGVNLQKMSMTKERKRHEKPEKEQRDDGQSIEEEEEEVEQKQHQGTDKSIQAEDEAADDSSTEIEEGSNLNMTRVVVDTSNQQHAEELLVVEQQQNENENDHHKKPRPPYIQPIWCLGMALIVIDSIGDFIFLGLAPLTLLAPLGSLSLGWNVILAPFFNPEEIVTRKIIFATAVIYVGTILTVLFASDTAPTYELNEIVGFMQNQVFLIYMSLCIILQLVTIIHGHIYEYSVLHYCGLSGCFGGQCVIFTKSASELIKNLVMNGDFDSWISSALPYVFLLGMVFCLLLQLYFLNTGLDKFDALIVVPLYQSFWNIFAITGGLVFFQEHKNMSQLDHFLYALGIVITLIGIRMFVLWRRRD